MTTATAGRSRNRFLENTDKKLHVLFSGGVLTLYLTISCVAEFESNLKNKVFNCRFNMKPLLLWR